MIRSLEARRLAGLTLLFVGLLIAFSALAFAAQSRPAPAIGALSIGLVVCTVAVGLLWRLPPVVPDEQRARDTLP